MAVTIVGTLEMIYTVGADVISEPLYVDMPSPTEQPLKLTTGLVFTDPAVDIRDTLEAYLAATYGLTSITRVVTPRAGAMAEWTAVKGGITRAVVLWQSLPLKQVGVELKQTVAGDTGTSGRGYQSVEIGAGASAAAKESVAIGANADIAETADYATAMGWQATVGTNAKNATAVGYDATVGANATDALAFGTDATASGVSSMAMGTRAAATANSALSVGTAASAVMEATALGVDAHASGTKSVAVGNDAESTGASSSALGWRAVANTGNSTAIGSLSSVSGAGSTALGVGTNASGAQSLAIGSNTSAGGTSSMSAGHNAYAMAGGSIALGRRAYVAAGDVDTTEIAASELRVYLRGTIGGPPSAIASTLQLADATGTLHTIGATAGAMTYDGVKIGQVLTYSDNGSPAAENTTGVGTYTTGKVIYSGTLQSLIPEITTGLWNVDVTASATVYRSVATGGVWFWIGDGTAAYHQTLGRLSPQTHAYTLTMFVSPNKGTTNLTPTSVLDLRYTGFSTAGTTTVVSHGWQITARRVG